MGLIQVTERDNIVIVTVVGSKKTTHAKGSLTASTGTLNGTVSLYDDSAASYIARNHPFASYIDSSRSAYGNSSANTVTALNNIVNATPEIFIKGSNTIADLTGISSGDFDNTKGNRFVVATGTNEGISTQATVALNASGDVVLASNVLVTGNISVTGTVDGVDIAASVYDDSDADARIAAASIEDLSDVPTMGTAGQVLAVNSGATALEYVAGGSGSSQWTTSTNDIYYTTGNVGIGTTAPAEALDVVGKANITDASNNVLISTGNSTITASDTVAVGYQALTALTTGTYNTAVGYQASTALTTGGRNTTLGYHAGLSLSTGGKVVAVGYLAGHATTGANSDHGQTFVGYRAGLNMTSGAAGITAIGSNARGKTNGSWMTVVGTNAYSSNTNGTAIGNGAKTGGYGVAVGSGAGDTNAGGTYIGYNSGGNNGSNNTVVGEGAGKGSGSYNVSVGEGSGSSMTTGASNVLIGYSSGSAITTESNTVAVGYQSLTALTTGAGNTAVGYQAGVALTTGAYNVLMGHAAGDSIINGNNNIALGVNALGSGNSGDSVAIGRDAIGNAASSTSIGIGTSAGRYSTGASNVNIGHQAGQGANSSSTFTNTVAVGYQALTALTTGAGNTAVGYQAGAAITTGPNNTLIGHETGGGLTTGQRNVEIGKNNKTNNSSYRVSIGYNTGGGGECVAIGDNALTSSSGAKGIAIGRNSGGNFSGSHGIFIGYEAGAGVGSGTHNVFLGFRQGKSATDKNYNVSIGGGSHALGDNNVVLGYEAGQNLTTASDGNVLLGYEAGNAETGSNKLYIENSNSTTPLIYGEFDNDILRVNGTLQVGDPAGTGFALPAIDGSANQTLQTDGSGAVTWATVISYPSEDSTKLSNIEANADVTNTASVTAAGAVMDSEIANLAQVKAFDSSDYADDAQGALADTAQQPPSEGAFVNGDKTKLDQIASGATVNSPDSILKARANHTGTQLHSTISDFDSATDARISNARTEYDFSTLETDRNLTMASDVSQSTSLICDVLGDAVAARNNANAKKLLGWHTGNGTVVLRGMIDYGSQIAATAGQALWLGASGTVSASAPTTADEYSRIIGHYIGAGQGGTEMVYFNPSPDWIQID